LVCNLPYQEPLINRNGKIDWCGSRTLEFEIKENETKTIELSGFKYGTLILPLLLFVLLIYVVAKTQLNTDLGFYGF